MGQVLETNPSSSNPAKTYSIVLGADGVTYCDCPGWKMRKICKHLKAYCAKNGVAPKSNKIKKIGPSAMPKGAVTILPFGPGGHTQPTKLVAAPELEIPLDRCSARRFNSEKFQSQAWYQGCGRELTKDVTNPSIMAEELTSLEKAGSFLAEPKLDGIWIVCFAGKKGNNFWSRNAKPKDYELAEDLLPAGTILIGELGFGSERAAVRREDYGHGFMDVFDILMLEYEPLHHLTDIDRRMVLEEFNRGLSLDLQARFRLVPQWTGNFVDRLNEQHEGLVIKQFSDQRYIGKRTKVDHWIKAKKWYEEDMVIMRWTKSEAETKTAEPMAESVTCGQYVDGKLTPLVKIGAMTDEWSKKFAQDFKTYKGQVMKIAHFGKFKSGSLRHPSMICIRDDKDPKDCIFEG